MNLTTLVLLYALCPLLLPHEALAPGAQWVYFARHSDAGKVFSKDDHPIRTADYCERIWACDSHDDRHRHARELMEIQDA